VVTTAVANTGSLTTKLQHTPSGGSAGDLCGATGITNDPVGTLYSLTSAVSTDLLSIQDVSVIQSTAAAAANVPTPTFVHMLWRPVVLPSGAVTALTSNHDPGTGACRWIMTYVPLDVGAKVVAA
jgi:hypothetical protein